MTRTVFFDLDGTLTDPKPGITRCIQHAMERLGEPAPEADDLTWCIGPPLLQSFSKLVGEGRAAEALSIYRERFSDVGLFENTVYEGVETCLSSLTADGLELCVASSKPRIYVTRILEHFALDRFFGKVFGSELDGTRTDKTELLRYALERCGAGAGAGASVMIGDRKFDMIGALENGMRPIGVLYGYGSRAELEEAGARTFVAAPSDLISALRSTV